MTSDTLQKLANLAYDLRLRKLCDRLQVAADRALSKELKLAEDRQ